MAPRLLKPVLCWICLCSVHSQETPLGGSVTGPNFLVTNWNWTRQLNLTCQAPDASTVERYAWFTPAYDTKRCDTNQSICTFQPRLEDDNETVICRLTYHVHNATRALYQVNLKYPPPSRPVVTTRSPQTHAVKQGDVITCTVTGGKPRVTNVTFHCQHPDHADREDDVSDDGTTVSSSIRVNTSQASNQSMLCNCSAHWDPEPGLYNETTSKEFILNLSVPIVSAPADSEALPLEVIVGIAAAAIVIAAIATVVICKIKKNKNKRRKQERNKSRDYYENPELIMEDMRSRQVATAGQPQAHGSQSPYAVSTVHQNKAFQINDDGGEYDVLGKPKPKPTPGPVPIYSHLS